MQDGLIFVFAFALIVVSAFGLERWGARMRRVYSSKRSRFGPSPSAFPTPSLQAAAPRFDTDPNDQLRAVMGADFEKRRLLSKSEAQVLYAAEAAIREQKLSWRVMAQVSLGEVLKTPDRRAFYAINAKRVDLLVITSSGMPVAAIEYQGGGHYQGTAAVRDAVKREALRRAGIHFIEITPNHNADDVRHEIQRLSKLQEPAIAS